MLLCMLVRNKPPCLANGARLSGLSRNGVDQEGLLWWFFVLLPRL